MDQLLPLLLWDPFWSNSITNFGRDKAASHIANHIIMHDDDDDADHDFDGAIDVHDDDDDDDDDDLA